MSYYRERGRLLRLFRSDKEVPAVYEIRSRMDPDRTYIGSSVNPKIRAMIHMLDLLHRKHHNYRLQKDYDLHGPGNFWFQVIFVPGEKVSRAKLYRIENVMIKKLKPYYNIKKKSKRRTKRNHS